MWGAGAVTLSLKAERKGHWVRGHSQPSLLGEAASIGLSPQLLPCVRAPGLWNPEERGAETTRLMAPGPRPALATLVPTCVRGSRLASLAIGYLWRLFQLARLCLPVNNGERQWSRGNERWQSLLSGDPQGMDEGGRHRILSQSLMSLMTSGPLGGMWFLSGRWDHPICPATLAWLTTASCVPFVLTSRGPHQEGTASSGTVGRLRLQGQSHLGSHGAVRSSGSLIGLLTLQAWLPWALNSITGTKHFEMHKP